jgi:hypothetical protein
VPVDALGEDAPGEQPDRGAGRGDEAVHANRLGLLPGLGEHRHDDAEDHTRGQRAAHALDEARSDQHLLALREAADQRRPREHGQTAKEDDAAPDQVAHSPGQQQQTAEGDQVGVDDPREARLREAEIVLDRW